VNRATILSSSFDGGGGGEGLVVTMEASLVPGRGGGNVIDAWLVSAAVARPERREKYNIASTRKLIVSATFVFMNRW
jgi:hypothetical protein